MTSTTFLLSPANLGGRRAGYLLRDQAAFDLAVRLRSGPAPSLGEVFAFLSGLYFRGKLAYAEAFGRAHDGGSSAFVITPSRGLLPTTHPAAPELLAEFAGVPIDLRELRYRGPLEASARALASRLGSGGRIVLLGSIATGKYVDVLSDVFGDRLLFPATFVGRGDMSRGGLMLRCARAGEELEYVPVAGAIRHGVRPPRLEPLRPARIT